MFAKSFATFNKNSVCQAILTVSLGVISPFVAPSSLIQPAKADSLEPVKRQDIPPEESPEAARSDILPDPLPLDSLESLTRVSYTTRHADTLEKLLTKFGLSAKDKQSWLLAMPKRSPLRKGLGPGRDLHFYFTKPVSTGAPTRHLKALEIELDDDQVLTWERGDNGVVFSKRQRPYDVEIKTVAGVVENSLTEDGIRAGLTQGLISQVADIFSWEIDFHKELKKGDTFKLVYEKRARKGQSPSFKILAAEITNQDQRYVALYFEKERGKGAYYGPDGRSWARAFLRFPLEFTTISSHFSHSRFHPILKVDRPHNGVDLAAKRGTPIRAVGTGKVVYSGWRKGGYGRLVEIQHDGIFSTRYAHLQRFARGLKKGMTVEKGQIIGYVGSSGRSTGPHLHYELYKDQEYVDPLNTEIPAEDTIEPLLLRVFQRTKEIFLAELAATPHS